jgi:CubicO group peptidase (beta-lactamase class C family)
MSSPSAKNAVPDWAEYEGYVETILAETQAPGVAIAVAREGEILFSRGFGYRDREEGLPATDRTVYGVASITKPFTAMAILQLEEEGKLSVDDPVVKWLPEFRAGRGERGAAAAQAMTIFHFLTHTSGLPLLPAWARVCARSLREDTVFWEDPEISSSPLARVIREEPPIDTYEQYLEALADTDFEVLGPPGAYVSYSNDAYGLLGAIIERVSGRRYQDFVKERILDPLGMEHSTFDPGVMAGFPEVATLYASRPKDGKTEVVRSPVWWEAPANVAAGWLRSNARDMLRFLEVFRGGGEVDGHRLLSPAGLARMMAPYAPWAPSIYRTCGFGLHTNYHGVSLVEHSGGLKGISAHAAWVPEKGLTAVALAGLAEVPTARLVLAALKRLLGLPPAARRFDFPAYACPPGRLGRYAGQYGEPGEAQAVITVEGVTPESATPESAAPESPGGCSADPARLVLEMGGEKLAGEPIAVDTFVFRHGEDESVARFLTNTRGEVRAVAMMARVLRRRAADGNG